MADAYPTDAPNGPAQAAENEMDVDIAAAFKAFTDPAVYNQPIKEDVKADPTLSTTKVGRMQKLSKLEISEQQSRTLVLTNVAVSTTRKTLEQTFLVLIKNLTGQTISIARPSTRHDYAAIDAMESSGPLVQIDPIRFPSIEVVYYRGIEVDDLSTVSTSLDKKLIAISGGGSKAQGATKLALVRFTNDTIIDTIITHFSGRIKIDGRHIFMYPGKLEHAELKQPQSIFISGLTDKKMDIELLLDHLEKKYKFILTNLRIFKEQDTNERRSFCIVELDKSCWPLDSRIWLTEDTIPDTNVTFKIMKCVSEKKAQKRKERSIRNEKFRRARMGLNQFTDRRQQGGPAILRTMQNKYRDQAEKVQRERAVRDTPGHTRPARSMEMKTQRDPSKKPRWTPDQRRAGAARSGRSE